MQLDTCYQQFTSFNPHIFKVRVCDITVLSNHTLYITSNVYADSASLTLLRGITTKAKQSITVNRHQIISNCTVVPSFSNRSNVNIICLNATTKPLNCMRSLARLVALTKYTDISRTLCTLQVSILLKTRTAVLEQYQKLKWTADEMLEHQGRDEILQSYRVVRPYFQIELV